MTARQAKKAASGCTWQPAPGAARCWCDTCGTRADLHPGSGAAGRVVTHILRKPVAA